jgi:4-hydroxy-3-polyprenylbenzoate decarboxylase
VIKHSEVDGARILGGGNVFITGKYFHGGSELSFKRMHFKGKDWGSIEIGLGSHLWDTCLEHRGEKIPATINIATPPAVNLVSATMFLHPIVPAGSDEIGLAGGIQGFPVDICPAKTAEAYSIANSEWVIEGYIDTAQRLWETEGGEKEGKGGVAPVMPEWTGYLGRDYRGFRFQVTAITHRKDEPIFFTPLAHSFEVDIASSIYREACFYELAERLVPGIVVDVNILNGFAAWGGGIVYQVRKRRGGDEGFQRNILAAALGVTQGLRMAVIVDDDIDIYSAEDVLWAIATRVNPKTGIIRGSVGGMGFPMMPTERAGPAMEGRPFFLYEGGMGLDATAPFTVRDIFKRAKYPVDKIDLARWLSDSEIAAAKVSQSEYARVLAQMGA